MPFSTDLPTPPAPLVPPDTDVSLLAGFMLNVDHLLASELVAIGTPEECWAALMLWCRAWKQIPAGSLPNDERVLASFSGAGRRWPKVREVALRGFVRCTDGRLYHRFLCAEVQRASARHTAFQERRDADRKRLAAWREKRRGNGGDTPPETPVETHFVALETERDGTGRDVEGKKEPNGSSFPDSDTKEACASLDCRAQDARTPPKEARGNGGSARRPKPKIQIAPDWQPDLADCAFAAARGWDGRRIGEEADAFADRCKRDQAAYADWNAAWRNWCRNADKFTPRPNGEAASRHTPARSGSFATAARNVAARYDVGDK